MFEGLLERILQQKLGKYLEGIDKNLNIGIWSGNILLENLKVKCSVLDDARLPLRLRFGRIKKLQIIVPWARLSSAPVEIILESLMLIVLPKSKDEWQSFDSSSFEYKQKILQEFAEGFTQHIKAQIFQKNESKDEGGYMDRLVTKIVDNIQVTIRNIHIRFEDQDNIANQPFSLGFTLKELSINTTNSNWEKSFFDRSTSENRDQPIFKSLTIQSFAIYLHVGDEFLLSHDPKADLKSIDEVNDYEEFIEYKLIQMFPKEADLIEGTTYLIQPMHLNLKMIQLIKTELDKPMFKFEVVLSEFHVKMKKKQYEVTFKLGEYFRQHQKYLDRENVSYKYKFLRPIFPIHYDQAKEMSIHDRQLNQYFAKKLLPLKAQPYEPIVDNTIDDFLDTKQEEDEEFFDAIDDEAVIESMIEEDRNSLNKLNEEEKQDSLPISQELQIRNQVIKNKNVAEWWQYAITCIQKDLRTQKGIWVSILIKRKLEKKKEDEDKKAKETTLMQSLFSWTGVNKKKNTDEGNNQDDILQFTDEEIEVIKQALQETQYSDLEELSISNEDKKRMIKFHFSILFTKGKISLEEKTYEVELYQEYLSIDAIIRRDASFNLEIKNQRVGVNLITHPENNPDEIIVTPVIQSFDTPQEEQKEQEQTQSSLVEEEKKEQEVETPQPYLWQFKFKKCSPGSDDSDEIHVDSNPLKILFEAKAVAKISQYFKLDATEELKAKALNKLENLKEQTQLSLQDLFYKKKTKIFVKVAAPVILMPFKAHNSSYIGEPEHDRGRMWSINLGIFMLTNDSGQEEKKLDEYEEMKLQIQQLSMSYYKRDKKVKVLEELQMNLSLKIKNKVKEVILKGQQDTSKLIETSEFLRPADVTLHAEIPRLNVHFSPDIYNGLVNLAEVLMSSGQEVELSQLKQDKDNIVKDSPYMSQIATRGVKNFMSYWQDYFVILSGSYLYFYKNKRDLMPYHYMYIGDCSHQNDIPTVDLNLIKSKQIDSKNYLQLNLGKKEKVYFAFGSYTEKLSFIHHLAEKQKDLRGENYIQEIISDIIHKDPNDLGFMLLLEINEIQLRIWNSTEQAIQDQTEQNEKQWLLVNVQKVKFGLYKYVFEIQLRFEIYSLLLKETEKVLEDILMNDPGKQVIKLNIDIYDLYCPKYVDSEIIVDLDLGRISILFEPYTLNGIVKFFRNVRTQTFKDLEAYQLKLIEEQLLFQIPNQQPAKDKVKIEQSCKNIKQIVVKVIVQAESVDILCLHHQYQTPFIEICVGYSNFKYKMFYDHDVMEGSFGNARVYELTNHPKTIIPTQAEKGCLKNLDKLIRSEVVGIRDQASGKDSNLVWFEMFMYYESCPLHKPMTYSSLKLDVSKAKIHYNYELSFRLIDYFYDKFLWGLSYTDPYLDFQAQQSNKNLQINFDMMETQEVYAFDMKQDVTLMDLEVKIHRPYIIIKDRPYSEQCIEVDLGEVIMTSEQRITKNRYKSAPFKEVFLSTLIIEAKDMGIKYAQNQFAISEPFDVKVEFSYLCYSPILGQINSSSFDKSYICDIEFQQALNLRMTKEIYTFFCRLIDLNFAYTDYHDDFFNFRNDEEYFKSTEYLLKSKLKMTFPLISIGLCDQTSQIMEILMRNPSFVIDYYLNRRCNYTIELQYLSMFFLSNQQQKQLLLGNLTHKHKIPIHESYEQTCQQNLGKSDYQQLQIDIQMFPNGKKDFQIRINDTKLFIHPYFYLMVDHFFREGIPVYDDFAFDKPNEYDSDYETYPELHMNLILKNTLVCFNNDSYRMDKTIACQCNIDYEFKREKIKKVKRYIIKKLDNSSALQDEDQQVIQYPITWMRLQFYELCPFICDLNDLEKFEFINIRKRQLITPFNLSYFYAKYLNYQIIQRLLNTFDKSELKIEKTVVKVSYKDYRLIQGIASQFLEGYDKFNQFYISYKQQQLELKQSQIAFDPNQMQELQTNFTKTTQKAFQILTNYSVQKDINSTKQKEDIKEEEAKEELKQQEINEEILSKKLDYENVDMRLFRFSSSGIQIVIINDYNNVFYPVLSVNIQNFKFKHIGENGKSVGETHLKSMISYFNAHAGEWEPLIEKTECHILVDQRNFMINFTKNLNINITDMLMQTLIETYRSLQEKEKVDAQAIDQQDPSSVPQSQLEFKVTPYTIQNNTSKKVTIRRVFDKYTQSESQIPKEYILLPGQQVEYEVDYEDEAKQLMRITRDELVRKSDFVNVLFNQGHKTTYRIEGLNLRDMRVYMHEFSQDKDDYISYGVKFENMRKVLILRAPYVINNRTDCDYKLKITSENKEERIIILKPKQCLPISLSDLQKKIQMSNCKDSNKEEWSNAIKIFTIVEKLPRNTTTFLYHDKQYSIIMKEKSEFPKSFNINIKTPVIIRNALPCNLRIKTRVIIGRNYNAKQSMMSMKSTQSIKEIDDLEYEEREFLILKNQTIQLHNYSIKDEVAFQFKVEPEDSIESDQQSNTGNLLSQSSQSISLKGGKAFQWGEAVFKNKEIHKVTKTFLIKDSRLQTALEVYGETKKSQNAGMQISLYVKNCIINNTDQRLMIYYDKKQPAAGCQSGVNSVILLNDRSKVMVCIESQQVKNFSAPFLIDIAAVTNTIQIRKELNQTYEFTVKTELSLAFNDESIYTKVTTISPCYVLNNQTKMTLLVSQEDCLENFQILPSGSRQPFFWKDIRKPKIARLKCCETPNADFDDKSHVWSFGFSLSELGKDTIMNRHSTSVANNKHIRIEKSLQEENGIVFITFREENPQFPTYSIENKTSLFQVEFMQKDHPHNIWKLQPKEQSMFSWTNPQADPKVICKFTYIEILSDAQIETKQELEIDNLELKQRIPIPINSSQQQFQQQQIKITPSKKNSVRQKVKNILQQQPQQQVQQVEPVCNWIYVDVVTNGYSKILRISDDPLDSIHQDWEDLGKEEKKADQDDIDEVPKSVTNISIGTIGLSLICKSYQGIRREFAFMYFESLKFIVIDTAHHRQVQLKVAYMQIDNNIGNKQIFPIIMYPKELVKRRDALKMKKLSSKDAKRKQEIEKKDFFNAHFSMRNDLPNMYYFEKIEFLVQTMVLLMDDELIGYMYKFASNITDQLHTNLTGVHEVFRHRKPTEMLGQQEERFLKDMLEEEKQIFKGLQFKQIQLQEEEKKELVDFEDDEVRFQSQVMMSQHIMTKRTNKKVPNTFQQFSNQKQRNNTQIVGDDTSSLNQSNNFTYFNEQSWLNYRVESHNKRLYIKEYKSSPLEVEVSFITRAKMDIDMADKKFSLKDKLKIFGLVLTNMDKAPLRINSLITSNIFGTPQEIVFLLKSHYIERMKKNLFTMIGSSNILGNPANFVSHLGTGVQDFFYKPIEGMVKGPLEGGKGLIVGTGSLIKNTVQGTFGSASKMLSSFSKGLLFITDDIDYINKREEENMDRPKNALEGVGYGLKSTFTGIASGITGVFEKPIHGAKQDGVKGFFVGTYKGVSGLVVKPLSGALDFFSKTSEGIKNNTSSNKEKQIAKIRTMRPFYGRQMLIKSYDEFHAYVTQHLKKINRGRYSEDHFIDALYYDTNKDRLVIVLTDEHLILVDASTRDVVNEYESQELFAIKKKNNTTLSLFTSKDIEALQLIIADQQRYERYFKKIKNYIFHVKTDF